MEYIFCLASAGGGLGFLLALNGYLPFAREELFASGSRHGRPVSVPLGPIVMAFTMLSFYAALMVFIIVGFLTERLSKSVSLAFAASFALTVVFAMVNLAGANWTLLSGGNVILLALMLGWTAGSGIRGELKP
jgi:hypothetical protein